MAFFAIPWYECGHGFGVANSDNAGPRAGPYGPFRRLPGGRDQANLVGLGFQAFLVPTGGAIISPETLRW